MPHPVIRVIGHLLRPLCTPRGRHRAGSPALPVPPRHPVTPAFTRPSQPGPYATDTPIDGRATAMVRPYLLTHEQRQRHRHRTFGATWRDRDMGTGICAGTGAAPGHCHGMAAAR